ncbi:MAG TPA: hypothetical protein VG711_00625, partial [Phycisphaerales bacterium]|nr:hypothetical protein [Phycisphaerales bacterium]
MEASISKMMMWICGLMQDAAASMPAEMSATAPDQSAAHSSLVQQIGVCIVAATLLGFIARLIKQPLLLAYIAAGVLIGPIG